MQYRQGIWFTKSKPSQQKNGQQHLTYMTIYAPGYMFTDPMGQLLIQSSKGYKYIVICYVADCNAIISEPIKNKTAQQLLRAYHKFYTTLVKAGYGP